MKKRALKGVMIAGAVISVIGAVGCSNQPTRSVALTKDDLIEKAVETFAKTKSVDADLDADMNMKLSATGLNMEVKYQADFNAVSNDSGESHVKGNMDISGVGLENTIELENYTVKDNNDFLRYTRSNEAGTEGTWTYSRASDVQDIDITSEMSISQLADAYGKLKDSLSELKLENGTVSFNNTSCYLVSGTITGDKLADLMSSSGQDIDAEAKESISMIDLDTELYFKASDETPYAVVMDMREAIENIIGAQVGDSTGMDISVDKMKFEIIFNSFDKTADINVPDNVKNSAVETVDGLDIQNLLINGSI